MPDDQFKVPEAVLEAFRVERRRKRHRSPRNRNESALAAALAQHHKELLGDEAKVAAGDALEENKEKDYMGWSHVNEMVKTEVLGEVETVLQAAIDSVMKGGDGG